MMRALYKLPLFIASAFLAYILLAGCDVLKVSVQRKAALKHWLYGVGFFVYALRMTVRGTLADAPALLVANHCSYIDVLLIARLGDIRFTPKDDVKGWPLIGALVTRFDVLYVNRAPGKSKEVQENIFAVLKSGTRICVFPEATTSDGEHLKPFKSSLFSLAEQWDGAEPLTVQPVSVVYRRVNGKPMDRAAWDKVAWFGDMDIVRHMTAFFTLKSVEAELVLHPPIALQPGESRKELCARAEALVKGELHAA